MSAKLRLYEIADELEEYREDNGPNGENVPFADTAKELRSIARNLNKTSTERPSGDFRDEPWEPR